MLTAPSRYYEPDFLRQYESLNTKSGEWWLQSAKKRYTPSSSLEGLGLDIASAPAVTHGVDTLMHVGDADGLGFVGGMNMKMLAALGLAGYGYMQNKDAKEAAIWGLGGYISPWIAGVFAVAIQMGWIRMPKL